MRGSRWLSANVTIGISNPALRTPLAGVPEAPPRDPGRWGRAGWGWARANLFSSGWSTLITLALGLVLGRFLVAAVQWGIVNAVWSVPNGQSQACRALRGAGACWAVVTEKYRFILFGTYPFDQQWRPALAVLAFVALFVISARRSFWRKELLAIWIAALGIIAALMWGGFLGLAFV